MGYLGVWTLFGIFVHLADLALHAVVDQSQWLTANAWVLGSATFLLAGAYQFTPLKHWCLDKCRSPFSFIIGQWRGRQEQRQSFALGIHHGLFCLGCCWSLMLLMFVVGIGNIAWMLLLSAVMAAEKNLLWGRRLSAPLGTGLLGIGLAVALFGLIS
jgi:predicted metal-binding membrane protein